MQKEELEKSLIVVKETPFKKIRKNLLMIFLGKDYNVIFEFEKLIKRNRPKDIIIPREIK